MNEVRQKPNIPDHELLRLIGRGSYGEVWLARNIMGALRAVKLVYRTAFDHARPYEREFAGLQKFEPVSRTHASHLDILHIGENQGEGFFYYIMELADDAVVKTRLAGRDHHVPEDYRPKTLRSEIDQRGPLMPAECIEIGLSLSTAVAHLHKNGLVHRDIKPSNIIYVNDQVKLADIGLVSAVDATRSYVGTLGYAPYEGPGTPQADIYSLGKVLYEAATGRDRQEFPELPTQLSGAPKQQEEFLELNEVLLKACDDDPRRRYQTADEMHEDLLALRSGKSLIRLRTIERRFQRARQVGMWAAVIALLIAAAYFYQAQQTRRVKKLAADNLALAEQAKANAAHARRSELIARENLGLAETRLREVSEERDAKKQALKDAEEVAKFLEEIFQSPDPSRDGRTITVAETLERAADWLNTDLNDQPDRRARLQATLGKTYLSLGLFKNAIPILEQVRDYWLAKAGRENTNTITALGNLAFSYADAGRFDDALKMREEVLALSRKVLGPDHPITLRSMNNLANSYDKAARRSDALKMREEVLALNRKVLGPEHPDTLGSLGNLARSYRQAGRKDEALKMNEEVLAGFRKVSGPEHPYTISSMSNLASDYEEAGRWDDALRMQEEVLALSRKVLGPEHPDTLGAMSKLVYSYHVTRRVDDAIKMQKEVLTLRRKVLGSEHPDTLLAMGNLANCYSDAQRPEEALKMREEALALSRKALGSEHPYMLGPIHNLANSYENVARWDEALKLRTEFLALSRKVKGPENDETLSALQQLGRTCAKARRVMETLKIAQEILEFSKDPDDLRTAGSIHDIGADLILAGEVREGRKLLKSLPRKAIQQWLVLAPLGLDGLDEMKALDAQQVKNEAELHPRAGQTVQAGGKELVWRAYESDDFVLDYNLLLGKEVEYAGAYAVCYLASETGQTNVLLTISSDDLAKVWLDGKQVYRYARGRASSTADTVQNLELKAGVTTLVLKVINGESNWQSSVSLSDPSGQPLKGVRVSLNPEGTGER